MKISEKKSINIRTNEPLHEKTNILHVRKQRRRSASQKFAVLTAKLISTFGFATQIIQFHYFLNPKFPASQNFQSLAIFCDCTDQFVSAKSSILKFIWPIEFQDVKHNNIIFISKYNNNKKRGVQQQNDIV